MYQQQLNNKSSTQTNTYNLRSRRTVIQNRLSFHKIPVIQFPEVARIRQNHTINAKIKNIPNPCLFNLINKITVIVRVKVKEEKFIWEIDFDISFYTSYTYFV